MEAVQDGAGCNRREGLPKCGQGDAKLFGGVLVCALLSEGKHPCKYFIVDFVCSSPLLSAAV